MTGLQERLLNDFQRAFPLCPEPFADLAARLGTDPAWVLETLRGLRTRGVINRVGPVFRPGTLGVSTLAAMAVPEQRIEQVAALVSAYPQVNHNYQREHRVNLWFVVVAAHRQELDAVLARIEQRTGLTVIALPMQTDYHIDLGFPMELAAGTDLGGLGEAPSDRAEADDDAPPGATPVDFVSAIQKGFPLVARPFAVLARRTGMTEQAVIERLGQWLEQGVIRRIGVVVRHHELGYRANAMTVWDVPAAQIDAVGARLGQFEHVTLCYRRRPHPQHWPYNLYCLIHGQDRAAVTERIEQITAGLELFERPRQVLFSVKRYKQCAARYRHAPPPTSAKGTSHG